MNLITILMFGLTTLSWSQQAPVVHDPVVIEESGSYHLFCTGKGISHFTSTDLQNWEMGQPVFGEKPNWTDNVVPNFENHIWAPDVIEHNGQYYLYYSVSAFAKNTSAIGVATTKSLDTSNPDYGWADHGIVVQSHPNRDMWNAIDPNIVFDENNTPWMAFGSFWDGLKMVKLDDSLLKIAEPQEWYTIARRERSFDLADINPGDAALEAPFIFKKDDYYYLFLSWDLCCRGENSTYKVVVGRSTSVTGPYLDANGKDLAGGGGTLVIQGNKNWYGVGHNSAYSFNGKDYFFSHAYDAKDNGRPKLVTKKIEWVNGWPKVKPMS
ncbi:MAG: arabinan endo-1,5-alpha-L-arabinosidase [Allomuricauda sp.]|uniref:Arabinan endo-1,5-alpha-L-arabinosidase n=1 Tax=Flagellimonas profundi TaxID=2915620 RepID=A0ABS3FJG2_9FLAO|nr:arabinan endo-1,5-alpha-L-arabinosidase [Allomuricauda profundi]MBO0343304.1 arabinan endo-1,5-alpha-L-arabinosidase [Allomuricauda profundi]